MRVTMAFIHAREYGHESGSHTQTYLNAVDDELQRPCSQCVHGQSEVV
jgi:hypothetical protein